MSWIWDEVAQTYDVLKAQASEDERPAVVAVLKGGDSVLVNEAEGGENHPWLRLHIGLDRRHCIYIHDTDVERIDVVLLSTSKNPPLGFRATDINAS